MRASGGEYANLEPGPYARLTIQDTGTGIPPEHVDKIFDPFFTTKAVGEATGMGLSIAHGVVTSLGMTITVDTGHGGPPSGSTCRSSVRPR